ncbi:hypothetical protein TrVE_jg13145 [Triparma verrucosa]|uniref:Protein kinase domain-containing protein n=1 Tax=Triparma verrucosa TaxID=1606542 RepID=A0A9W7ETC7_9STRA|nr:hypothetical protein TrVE_jg13145 [Triparma verrucosa]
MQVCDYAVYTDGGDVHIPTVSFFNAPADSYMATIEFADGTNTTLPATSSASTTPPGPGLIFTAPSFSIPSFAQVTFHAQSDGSLQLSPVGWEAGAANPALPSVVLCYYDPPTSFVSLFPSSFDFPEANTPERSLTVESSDALIAHSSSAVEVNGVRLSDCVLSSPVRLTCPFPSTSSSPVYFSESVVISSTVQAKVFLSLDGADANFVDTGLSLDLDIKPGSPSVEIAVVGGNSHFHQVENSTIVALIVVFVFVLILSIYFNWSTWRNTKAKVDVYRKKNNTLSSSVKDLTNWNKYLAENLKRQTMRNDELEVMKDALDSLSKERSNLLKEVMIPSKEILLMDLLGKGGNGEVHLAMFRNQRIALKRIVRIDQESVKRFRFECFMMKELRHPNIVKLVGVCWDDIMMACCLEYVENGTLETWLRKSVLDKIAANKLVGQVNNSKESHTGNISSGHKHSYGLRNSKNTSLRQKSNGLSLEECKLWHSKTLAQACFEGWASPLSSLYTQADLDLADRASKQILKQIDLVDKGKGGWKEIPIELETFDEEFQNRESDLSTFKSYVKMGQETIRGLWECACEFEVNVTPSQYMASQMHKDNYTETPEFKRLGEAAQRGYLVFYCQYKKLGSVVKDREMVYRGVGKYFGAGRYLHASESCEHEMLPARAGVVRTKIHPCGQIFFPISDESGKIVRTKVFRYLSIDLQLPKILNILGQRQFTLETARTLVQPQLQEKLIAEKLVEEYMPVLTDGLTWKEHVLPIMTECAAVMNYLHQARYYKEEDKEYKECIIHRDLKPENMLLTRNFSLRLADFGESRAADERATMSVVGTPLFIAPEIQRNERYDSKVDTYSFAMCLVACIRAEKNLFSFLMECLRKDSRRSSMFGIGMFMLTSKMLNKKWRPRLPRRFINSYPKLNALIHECWDDNPTKRPTFEDIHSRMKGEILAEVMLVEEPDIELLSVQDDSMYHYDYANNANEEIDPEVENKFRSELHAVLDPSLNGNGSIIQGSALKAERPNSPEGLSLEPIMSGSAIRRMKTELEIEKMKNKKLIEENLEQSMEVVKLRDAMVEKSTEALHGLLGDL